MAMVSSYRLDAARLSADRRISAAKGDWAAARSYDRLIREYLRLANDEERKCHEKEDAVRGQKTLDSIMSDWKF